MRLARVSRLAAERAIIPEERLSAMSEKRVTDAYGVAAC